MCRRLAASNANGYENAPNFYEMPVSENREYEAVQIEANAQTTNASKPSVPPRGTTKIDTTLVDNDLYQ